MVISARVRHAMLLRSFAVQGSWNYRTLLGTGFAFMLLPALRHVYQGDPEGLRAALTRHAALFNSHPYLAPVAAGAVARLEADGAPPELQQRFKEALRGPLGALGDRLFWLSWRPACALLGVALLLLGAPWWTGPTVFLLAYNAVHLPIRAWGLDVGLRAGLQIGASLRSAALERWANRIGDVGVVLAGFSAVLAAGQGTFDAALPWASLIGAVAGLALGAWTRRIGWAVLVAGWLVLLAGTFIPHPW